MKINLFVRVLVNGFVLFAVSLHRSNKKDHLFFGCGLPKNENITTSIVILHTRVLPIERLASDFLKSFFHEKK